jgi:hypothetical protein
VGSRPRWVWRGLYRVYGLQVFCANMIPFVSWRISSALAASSSVKAVFSSQSFALGIVPGNRNTGAEYTSQSRYSTYVCRVLAAVFVYLSSI